MAIVSLTVGTEALNISSESIVLVVEEGATRKLYYDRKGIAPKVHDVVESLAAITSAVGAGGAGNLYTVTVGDKTIALNADKTVAIAAEGAGSRIFYSGMGMDMDEYVTVEDPSAIEAAIDAL